MPRQHKGYDSVSYKTCNQDGNKKLDPRFMTTFRPGGEKDKRYYTEHTYESPVSGYIPNAICGTAGRRENLQEME